MTDAKTVIDIAKLKDYFGAALNPLNLIGDKAKNWNLETALGWYEDATVRSAHKMMGDINGKTVLEIGCGTGAHLIWLARRGANVTGADISPERIESAKKLIETEKMKEKISVVCEDIMHPCFSCRAFDIIYGHDILMYMGGDYSFFASRMYDMLKPDGKIVIVEALDRHPMAHIYRNIFLPKEFRYFTRYFNISGFSAFRNNYRYLKSEFFYILAPLAFIWKVWIASKVMFDLFERSLARVDKLALRAFPVLQKYCWRVVFEAQK